VIREYFTRIRVLTKRTFRLNLRSTTTSTASQLGCRLYLYKYSLVNNNTRTPTTSSKLQQTFFFSRQETKRGELHYAQLYAFIIVIVENGGRRVLGDWGSLTFFSEHEFERPHEYDTATIPAFTSKCHTATTWKLYER